MVPLTAVTVMVYVLAGVNGVDETVSVELPDAPDKSVTLVTFRDDAGADKTEGVTEAMSAMLPTNPLRLVTVILEEADDPAVKLRSEELAAMEKSGTLEN